MDQATKQSRGQRPNTEIKEQSENLCPGRLNHSPLPFSGSREADRRTPSLEYLIESREVPRGSAMWMPHRGVAQTNCPTARSELANMRQLMQCTAHGQCRRITPGKWPEPTGYLKEHRNRGKPKQWYSEDTETIQERG